jgi:hypothetical protein
MVYGHEKQMRWRDNDTPGIHQTNLLRVYSLTANRLSEQSEWYWNGYTSKTFVDEGWLLFIAREMMMMIIRMTGKESYSYEGNWVFRAKWTSLSEDGKKVEQHSSTRIATSLHSLKRGEEVVTQLHPSFTREVTRDSLWIPNFFREMFISLLNTGIHSAFFKKKKSLCFAFMSDLNSG